MPMDVKEVRFYVLDVGQGACNYVEIVNSHNVVIHNMLIDLGTSSRHVVAQQNIVWLKNRIKDRPDPRIDVLMLTHGDLDHYNLVSAIFPALDPPSTARITMVRYGGLAWRYRANKAVEKGNSLIKALERYCANVNSFTNEMSNYDKVNNVWGHIWPAFAAATDPRLRILVANCPHPQDKTLVKSSSGNNGVAVNTKSIVYDLVWDGHGFVGTGDATAYTFNIANTYLAGATIPPVPMLTMPHHGSRVTTYDLKLAEDDPSDEARKVVATFAAMLNPWTMTVSANESGHWHPSLYAIEQFAAYTSGTTYWNDPFIGTETHFLTGFVDLNIVQAGSPPWPDPHTYATLQTDRNVYSTLYYVSDWIEPYQTPPLPADTPEVPGDDPMLPAPARGRNWAFSLAAGGALTVESSNNVHPATTVKEAFAAVPPAAAAARSAGARLMRAPAESSLVPSRKWVARRNGLAASFAAPVRRVTPGRSAARLSGLRPIR